MVDIAIVGIGCRFPGGARGPAELWSFLIGKGDGIVDIPADRWNLERYYDPDPDVPGRMYTRRGGFLPSSLAEFDPEFFGISPREATIMDPQQRLLLEVTQEALDDAGLAGRVAGRSVGVYIGGFTMDNQVLRHVPTARSSISSHTATSGTYTMLSNRLSFVYDLRGPSMTIDTACSSSLVALHQAYQALARGEIDMALTGGVNVMLAPETFVAMCKGRFLAPDGRCKTFDAAADGYARGEGVGVLVLKPLDAARADGDRVYAVVKATGSNQDGRTTGITVPNPQAQADLIRRVVSASGVAPADIGYVEAHGTGTAVGDPLELQAIGETLGALPDRRRPLVVGSIKNSIGHTEAAAGVASVIKAALTVHHRQVAPQFSLDELNPAIPFDDYRVSIPTESAPFPEGYPLAVASVNGFGYGGTNAHAVVAEPPPVRPDEAPAARRPPARVFPLSGRNDAAARHLAGEYADLAAAADDVDALVDAAWTRRAHQPFRFAVPFRDAADLRAQLAAIAVGDGRTGSRTVAGPENRPVFVLSGMGPQWWRMGRDLLLTPGAFVDEAHRIDDVFAGIAGWSIVEELLRDEAESRVARTDVAQPANFLVQVALAAELERLGVRPAAIVGHSVGEVSAAYLSGALSLTDALTVSYHRSRLQATTAGTGGMLAVGLPEAEAVARIAGLDGVCVAAVNSPSAVTLAGRREGLGELRAELVEAGVFARELRVEVPYHSHLMDPILPELVDVLAGLDPQTPTVPLVSTVTGAPVDGPTWGPRYWADNVRLPVRFADALGHLVDAGHRVFLEIGPHPVLSGNVREILVRRGETGACVPTLSRDGDDLSSVRQAVAELYVAGALDETRAPGGDPGPAPWTELPRHPFQRVRLWSAEPSIVREHLGTPGARPLPGQRTTADGAEWETGLGQVAFPWLRDHVVGGLVLLPGAAYLDAALAAAAELTGRDQPALADVLFVAPLVVGPHEAPVLRLSVEGTTGRFAVRSRPADGETWTLHATGRIVDGQVEPSLVPASTGWGDSAGGSEVVVAEELYEGLRSRGLEYGPTFRRLLRVTVGADRAVATLDSSIAAASTDGAAVGHLAHPAVTDAALQCMAALVGADETGSGAVVPAGVGAVRLLGRLADAASVDVVRRSGPDLRADIAVRDTAGAAVLELQDVEFRPVAPRQPVLTELEPLWHEPTFEPRSPRGSSAGASLAGRRLLVVALGGRRRPWADALARRHPGSVVATALGDDPGAVADGLRPVVRDLLSEGTTPVLVAVTGLEGGPDGAVGHGADPDAGSVAATADDVAGLVGTARAVQEVLDELVLDGAGADLALRMDGVVLVGGALAVPGDRGGADVLAGALLGARRTLRNEQPGLRWRCVDAEAGTPVELIEAELAVDGEFADDDADEVALRDGVRMVLRARRTLDAHLAVRSDLRPATPDDSWRIELPGSGALSELALREVSRTAPGPGQVELRIEGIGLNYKDGLKALGVLGERELAGTYFGTGLGMEALGVVTRVGPGVTRHAVGDRRFVGARDMGRRYVTVDVADLGIEPLPRGWTLADIPSFVPFVTAHYGLVHLARVRPGETVLVHGAASGVGRAAVQVAKHAGAVVIGSAGTPERRAAVLSAGADHVVNSRSLAFVDAVAALTGGRGVDVVISSAPGEVVAANLRACAEFGRVVEVGKSEIYGRGVLELAPFDRNLSFSAVDLDRMYFHRRDLFMQMLHEAFALFDEGAYTPLPSSVFGVSRMTEAFDAVLRSAHAGRVVLDFTEPDLQILPAPPSVPVRSDASYLITGGLGSFGLATARWLAGQGARHLVLVGRRGVTTADQRSAVARLQARGVAVTVETADVADPVGVDGLLDRLATLPPLRGVFHAAGVLADRAFTEIAADELHRVLDPKAVGAWNLHEALSRRGTELDHFVLYSSVTAIAGTVPQVNYAAANGLIDGLAHYRRARGLPGLSVNWGALSGGMAESSEDVVRYLAMIGLRPVDLNRAGEYLGETLALGVPQVTLLDIDWARWGTMHPASATSPRFAELIRAGGSAESGAGVLRAELAAMPDEQRAEVLTWILAEQLASVLGIPSDTVDVATSLPDLGLDSLMAVELGARVNVALDLEISALEFSRGGGLAALAARLADQLTAGAQATPAAPAAPATPATPATPVTGVTAVTGQTPAESVGSR